MPPRALILVADDNPDMRSGLKRLLEDAGFDVDLAEDGEQAIKRIERGRPALALIDVDMPVKTGWEVVSQLKSDRLLRHIPILLLSSLAEVRSKVHGLELGANDYITKPFEPAELIARVRGAISTVRSDFEANPLSGLPGNPAIERDLIRRIKANETFAVLYVDLNNFKAFNDHFGFKRGDDILRQMAQTLLRAALPGDFIGHIGGDDFIIVTAPANAEAMCRRIVAEFRAAAPGFYDAEFRRNRYIAVADRQGKMVHFPFVDVAVGAFSNEHRRFTSVSQIAALGAQMKTYAKSVKESYVFNRRAEDPLRRDLAARAAAKNTS